MGVGAAWRARVPCNQLGEVCQRGDLRAWARPWWPARPGRDSLPRCRRFARRLLPSPVSVAARRELCRAHRARWPAERFAHEVPPAKSAVPRELSLRIAGTRETVNRAVSSGEHKGAAYPPRLRLRATLAGDRHPTMPRVDESPTTHPRLAPSCRSATCRLVDPGGESSSCRAASRLAPSSDLRARLRKETCDAEH